MFITMLFNFENLSITEQGDFALAVVVQCVVYVGAVKNVINQLTFVNVRGNVVPRYCTYYTTALHQGQLRSKKNWSKDVLRNLRVL